MMNAVGIETGYSVVIPVYNSEQGLPLLIEALISLFSEMHSYYEIILVNDGSRDKSWEVICKLEAQHDHIIGINLMRNYGQHNALLCGIRAAHLSVTITMDDDQQHPPSEIQKLLDRLPEGYDVVYGISQARQHGLWRDMASQLTKLVLQNAMGVSAATNISAFRVFRTQIREAFAAFEGNYVSIDVLLTWGTTRFIAVSVRHQEREYGKSNYTFRTLIRHTLNLVTGFSILPLRFASLIGFGFTGFGFLILLYVVGRYLIQGEIVPGFPFLASIIAIFSGVQLFALGVIGEYIAGIHARSMNRPAYTVRDQIGKDNS